MSTIAATTVESSQKRGQFSLGTIRGNAGRFAARWKGTTQENANTQLFWAEFLGIFGIDHKRTVLFERHATRLTTGNEGRIDVFWPGEMVVEQKSGGKNLTKAANQAFDYLDHLDDRERPHTVVVSDFEHFEVYDLTSFPFPVVKFKLNQLPQRIGLFSWMAGYTRRPATVAAEESANRKAVQKMADLYDALAKENLSDHHTSIFLTRILFLLFAEDTGLVDRGLFAQVIRDRSAVDGSDLGGLLADLFQTLDTASSNRPERTDDLLMRFPYVNGSVFSEPIPLTHFDTQMRTALLAATDFEWGTISPAIFGSMFQAVKSKQARRELGEHYTTERDILRTLGPLFLDDLKSELAASRFSAKKLQELWDKIASLSFLDPACGCGNFLVVIYRELRELELQIMERLQELSGNSQTTLVDKSAGLKVSLSQLHGIEIEEWPAKIAETALFITDHQANRRMIEQVGFAPDRLPLQTGAKIVRDNALSIDWNWVVTPTEGLVVVGNPPFIGISLRNEQQTEDLRTVWGPWYHGSMDFVTGWYKKAADFLAGTGGRAAFVSTSSICQGEQVAPLWAPLFHAGFHINFAHQTFAWTSEASGKAAVHVVIIGFSQDDAGKPELYTYADIKGEPVLLPAKSISPYLVEGPPLAVLPRTKPLSPSLTEVRYGNKPTDGGYLVVESDDYSDFMRDRHAAKYLRPYVGARELIHNEPRWCLWLADLDPADYKASGLLQERVEGVRAFRQASKAASTRAAAATARLFRQIAQSETDFLCIPRHVSESRLYFPSRRYAAETISSDANFIADDPDGLLFAVISTSAFIAWQRTVGGKIKSDLRFSKLGVWNTFPLPQLNDAQRADLIAAGEAVEAARAQHPDRSLAGLYEPNAMPLDLMKAHQALDRVMDRILFGRKKTVDNDARLAALFDLYAAMTAV